LIIIWIYL